MLAVLTHEPRAIRTATMDPIIQTSWMKLGPRPTRLAGVLLKLAPGVYIVRHRQWLPATALDGNAELPSLPVLEIPKRRLPWPEWHNRAYCKTLDHTLFFGDETGARPALRRSVLARARRVCRPCAVQVECLEHALSTPERYGIWGGTSGRDREKLQERVKAGELIPDLVLETLVKLQ